MAAGSLGLLREGEHETPQRHSPTKSSARVVSRSDTGIGIAPQDIPRALERFGHVDSSLSRKYEGTGLGLPLSKCLVELHGGRLEIDSVVGTGTTVTARFPAERVVVDRQAA